MRETVQKVLYKNEDITIRNSRSINWSKFTWKSGYHSHILTEQEIYKPYLIAYKYYGEVEYEDIILLLNNIEHIFDCRPGIKLRIPKINDIDDFLLENKA